MATVNSFTETTNNLINQVNIALESMQKMSSSMTTEEDSVSISVEGQDPITGDVSVYNYSIPSYQFTLNKLERISETVDTFVRGDGVVLLNDGTYREVKAVPVAKQPENIINVEIPEKFRVKSNWFFESLMFPSLYVRFDLKDKIDDRSNRAVVKRVIFDNHDENETEWFKDTFVGETYTYAEVVDILQSNNKRFWEDEETKFLPLKTRRYRGKFLVVNKRLIENKEWIYLDNLNYSRVTDEEPLNNLELKVGDKLRYENSIFKVKTIEVSEKRIQVIPLVGTANLTSGKMLEIYSPPFENKFLNVAIGYNECQIVFIKGVNEDFNIISDEWGDSIAFYSNDLTLAGNVMSLQEYYYNFVADFGKKMEAEAKEQAIPAFFGVNPPPPEIDAEMFGVKQINLQLNAALDREEIKDTQTQVESSKTIINSLKSTISQQKSELVELIDSAQRADLQEKIDSNISELSKKTIEYQSLVKSLSTLAFENDAVIAEPKYRIRGFFPIPEGLKRFGDEDEPKQEIIQFEIAYRYLRLDNTANPLNTFSYTDPSTGQRVTGTFSDWNIKQTPIKKKRYDESKERYVWEQEDIGDGDQFNINQVDIPIRKGEKVEIRIRSISEAGWPTNPKKSEWSDTVIIEFPANLQGSDQVKNILSDATSEEQQIQLDETLNATGVLTHLEDGFPNPNVADGTYFKHQSRFLEYSLGKKDVEGDITEERSIDLQTLLGDFAPRTYVTITKPSGSGSSYSKLTGKLQSLLQAIINIDPSIYDEFQNIITT